MKDKKQTIQMIVLGLLVAAVAGICVVSFGGKKPAPPAPTAQAQVEQPSESTLGLPSEAAPSAVPDESVTVSQASVVNQTSGRDPFMPTMNTEVKMAYAPSTRPFRGGSVVSRPLPPLDPNFFGGGSNNSGWDEPMDSGNIQPLPVPDPIPPFVLTGIITGTQNVAIIRVNDSRYIVREGQMVEQTYKVISISEDEVILGRDGHSNIFLKLGGNGNAN